MKKIMMLGAIAAATAFASAGDVYPGVFFGSGNSNGNFTVNRASNVEIGMRAKLPYVGTTHYDGDHTYTYTAGTTWNFDWSINTDVSGTGGNDLNDFTYVLSMFKRDADGSNSADAESFDLINLAFADHSIGNNSTTAANDTVATNSTEYGNLIADNNVAQNSWRYAFFNGSGSVIENYNVNAVGTYLVRLTAYDGASEVVSTDITVNVVPLPTAAFAGLGLLGVLGGARVIRRR